MYSLFLFRDKSRFCYPFFSSFHRILFFSLNGARNVRLPGGNWSSVVWTGSVAQEEKRVRTDIRAQRAVILSVWICLPQTQICVFRHSCESKFQTISVIQFLSRLRASFLFYCTSLTPNQIIIKTCIYSSAKDNYENDFSTERFRIYVRIFLFEYSSMFIVQYCRRKSCTLPNFDLLSLLLALHDIIDFRNCWISIEFYVRSQRKMFGIRELAFLPGVMCQWRRKNIARSGSSNTSQKAFMCLTLFRCVHTAWKNLRKYCSFISIEAYSNV